MKHKLILCLDPEPHPQDISLGILQAFQKMEKSDILNASGFKYFG